nr:hypothetical protein [Campylobacter sp.]
MKILFIISLLAFSLNADEIKISGNSKIFDDFKTQALQYDTSIPAYDYAFTQELLPQTIEKMIKVDDDIGLDLINQVQNLNSIEESVGNFNVLQIAKDHNATKCIEKLKEIGYRRGE